MKKNAPGGLTINKSLIIYSDMNKNAYTSSQLRAMRAEHPHATNTRQQVRDWLRTAAEVISLALLAAALAFLLWAI